MTGLLSNLKKALPIRGLIARSYLQYRKIKSHLTFNYFPEQSNLITSQGPAAISSFSNKIDVLKEHIDRDYCFLDIPDYRNIGDHMIYEGSLKFLSKLPHQNKYQASINTFDEHRVGPNDIILMQGGGNFGDFWSIHQHFRERIVASHKKNKIIIFPQTIFFQNHKNLKKTISVFSGHPNLTICARDKRSYTIAKNNFTANTTLLLPDMATYLDLGVMKRNTSKKSKVLYIKRTDKELNQNYTFHFIANLIVSDWPTYNYSYFNHLPDKHKNSQFYLKEGITFMASFDLVISTRLHGAIMALLLGIPTILIDNSYGKNSTYYETWLAEMPYCYFAHNKDEVKILIEKHIPETIK